MKKSVAIVLAVLTAAIASAQAQTYPSKPITIIVPFAAGGQSDALWLTRLCVRVLPISLRTSSRGSSRGRKRSPCFTRRRSKSGGRSSEKLASRRSEFFEKLPSRNVGSWWKLTYGPGRRSCFDPNVWSGRALQAPCQHFTLAGLEHGRTIPLADLARIEMPHCGKSSLLTNLLCFDLGFGAADAICPTEASRVHNAARRGGSNVAARGTRAAVVDAGDRIFQSWYA